MLGQIGAAPLGRIYLEFGANHLQCGRNKANFGRNCPNTGRNKPEPGRHGPVCCRNRPTRDRSPGLSESGPTRGLKCGRTQPKCGRVTVGVARPTTTKMTDERRETRGTSDDDVRRTANDRRRPTTDDDRERRRATDDGRRATGGRILAADGKSARASSREVGQRVARGRPSESGAEVVHDVGRTSALKARSLTKSGAPRCKSSGEDADLLGPRAGLVGTGQTGSTGSGPSKSVPPPKKSHPKTPLFVKLRTTRARSRP